MTGLVRLIALCIMCSAITICAAVLWPLGAKQRYVIRLGMADSLCQPSADAVLEAYRAFGRTVPRQIRREDLEVVATRELATDILTKAQLVYRYFPFVNHPARETATSHNASLIQNEQPGMCDAAALVFGRLLDRSLTARNVNIIAPKIKPNFEGIAGPTWHYSGHTVSEVKTDRGALLIDPTYGFVLVTPNPRFTRETFRSQAFEMFTLVDITKLDAAQVCDLQAGLIYLRAASPESSVAPSGDRMNPVFPRFRIPPRARVSIGRADETNQEFTNQLGGWGNHVGYWYEPTTTHWQFAPGVSGQYRVTYSLLDSNASVTKVPLQISIEAEGALLLSEEVVNFEPAKGELSIIVSANGPFSILIGSRTVSARLIDAIEVEQISVVDACENDLLCYGTALASRLFALWMF